MAQVVMTRGRSGGGYDGSPRARVTACYVGGVNTSATYGTFELDANADNTQSRFNWNRVPRAGPVGIGCQEQVQLELVAKSRFNWNRLSRAGLVGIVCQEQVQLESGVESRSCWNWLPRADSIGIGCQEQGGGTGGGLGNVYRSVSPLYLLHIFSDRVLTPPYRTFYNMYFNVGSTGAGRAQRLSNAVKLQQQQH
uniref:Predicted protein n=1 Tax=Physcomitrium patens TaxID=3218 RepID=A9U597_PHYPA